MKKYRVWFDGNEVDVKSAKASALPLNKIWDGSQRPIDQCEEIYFVSIEFIKASDLIIEVEEEFESFEIRPNAYNLFFEQREKSISINIDKPMQFSLETDGMHGALHIFIDPPSVLPAKDKLIYFGPGEHKADLIWLESGQTVYIDRDAIVYGVIYSKDANNIKIMGRGVLDSSPYRRGNDYNEGGQEISNALRSRGFSETDLKYYGNIVVNHCTNVLIEGIVLKDAPLWSLIVRNDSENVTIDNVKIIGQWRYNSDGIDICTSKNVTVRNCFVRSFDDCIVARGAYLEGEYGNVEGLTVENCVLWCDWGKSLEVWCGHKPTTISNIRFKDIFLVHLSVTAINITTWYGSKKSVIDDVSYKNIFVDIDHKYMNPTVESSYRQGYTEKSGFLPRLISVSIEKLGKMIDLGSQKIEENIDYTEFNIEYKNLSFENVKCVGGNRQLDAVFEELSGVHKIENVSARNCDFEMKIEKKEKL